MHSSASDLTSRTKDIYSSIPMFLTGLGATASRIWSLQKRTSRGIPCFSRASYLGCFQRAAFLAILLCSSSVASLKIAHISFFAPPIFCPKSFSFFIILISFLCSFFVCVTNLICKTSRNTKKPGRICRARV